jgi:hypothetical protein
MMHHRADTVDASPSPYKYYQRCPQIKDHQLRVYAAMIAALDDGVGKVLDAVDKSGQANNTLIVFASDNGCAEYVPGLCSCLPLRGSKLSHYEGGVRVPFMMRWPGHIKPDTVYHGAVSLMDVLPTSLAAAGGELPADRIYDGVNLMPWTEFFAENRFLIGVSIDRAGRAARLLPGQQRRQADIPGRDAGNWISEKAGYRVQHAYRRSSRELVSPDGGLSLSQRGGQRLYAVHPARRKSIRDAER